MQINQMIFIDLRKKQNKTKQKKKKRPLKYWLHLKLCQEKEMY